MDKEPTLFIVATPIGNLEDMSFRAIRVLTEVDLIACEDTRHTVKLLNHFKINNKLESYHQHNMREKGPKIIKMLEEGKKVAVVSDAGTPGISDPGEELVKLAIQKGIHVSMIPGPVAGIMGLVLSGFDASSFVFEGFLPTTGKHRKEKIIYLELELRTIVLYEAPHRLIKTLTDLLKVFGNRNIVIARELTKKFEQVQQMTIEEGIAFYGVNNPKGEFVLIVEGKNILDIKSKEIENWQKLSIYEHFQMYLNTDVPKNEAMKIVAKERGIHRREVYSELIKKD